MRTVNFYNHKAGLFSLCLLGMMTFGTTTASAQITKETIQQRRELLKASRAELNDRATKAARKEAKTLAKEGWKVAPGAMPLEKQLDKAYFMESQIEDSETMYPKFIIGEAMSIGETYDAAKMQALEIAKLNLAEQIQTEVTAIVDNSLTNQQLPEEEAVSVTKTLMESKSLISQSIGRTVTVMECYRDKDGKRKEVRVRIAYNGTLAKNAAKNAIRQTLEKEGKDMHETLDKVFGTK